MNKFRSTINPITIAVNLILYIILLVLVYTKSPEYLLFLIIVEIILLGLDCIKYSSYKYFFEDHRLVIIHKRIRYTIPYNKIKYIESNTSQTGLIYGYGYKRVLISTGKGIDESYLITPTNEKEFIEKLENEVSKAKKDTK